MTLVSHPRRQAILVATLIWLIDAPLILAPAVIAGQLTIGGVAQALILVVCGWLLCLGLYELLHRLPDYRASVRLAAGGGLALGGGLLLGVIDTGAFIGLGHGGIVPILGSEDLLIRFITNTIFVVWMFVLFAAIVLLLEANNRVMAREAALARAETQATQAQSAATAARLAALRYQLNPHFLFNTLNAVSAAVMTGRNDQAEVMLARLAEFLRVTLSADPTAEVRLEEELGTAEAYLEIEAERFRQRLSTEIVCPERLRDARVPSFMLQPLIENAIKHGVSRSRSRVRLVIQAAAQGDDLVLSVTDDARPLKSSLPAPSSGIGLAAIRERLEVLYGPRGVLVAEPREAGFTVTVRLPLRSAAAQQEVARCAF